MSNGFYFQERAGCQGRSRRFSCVVDWARLPLERAIHAARRGTRCVADSSRCMSFRAGVVECKRRNALAGVSASVQRINPFAGMAINVSDTLSLQRGVWFSCNESAGQCSTWNITGQSRYAPPGQLGAAARALNGKRAWDHFFSSRTLILVQKQRQIGCIHAQ